MTFLRQSTAAVVAVGAFLDKMDGLTPKTALTTQDAKARLIKAGVGGTFTASSWNHDQDGTYLIGLSTSHTDTVGALRLSYSDKDTYVGLFEDFTVLPPAVYDNLFGAAGGVVE